MLSDRCDEQSGSEGRYYHDSGGDKDSADESTIVFDRIDSATPGGGFSEEHPGKQESRDGEEDIDTTGNPAVAEQMEQDDAGEGEAAHTVEFGKVAAFREPFGERVSGVAISEGVTQWWSSRQLVVRHVS